MTQKKAQRYVRLGTYVPEIYPGSLEGLTEALKAAHRASQKVEGTHRVRGVYEDGSILLIRAYNNGEDITDYLPEPQVSTLGDDDDG